MELSYNDIKKYAAKITKLAPYPLEKEFKEAFEEMAVHTRKRKPKELLLDRRPNEPKDVYDYRLKNYEPITYGSMNQAFDNINRILNKVSYSLTVPDEEVTAYTKLKKFKASTFDQYFQKIYLKRMIEDANGFLLWLPGGKGLEDSGTAVMPYPELMFSFNLVDWDEEKITFLSDKKSEIKQGETFVKSGKIYYILTKTNFYTYTELTGGRFELKDVYKHNLGEIPYIILGGDFNADGLYESFFAPYLAFGNEAIRQFSDWQAISTTASFPIREEFMMECDVQEVKKSKGKPNDDDNLTYSRQVEVRKINRSPHGTILRTAPNDSQIGEGQLAAEIPSVRFISPGVEYVKNAQESYTALLTSAEDALHLHLGQGDLSGYAKELDLQNHEDMLGKIASQLLSAKQESLRFITAYIKNVPFEETNVKLVKPSTFRVKTEVELIDELTKLKAANAPSMIISAVARELASLRFSGDEINQKIFETIATYDPLFIFSVSEKQSKILGGTATKNDVIKSDYFYSTLLNLSKEKGDVVFLEYTNATLNEMVDAFIKPFLVTNTQMVDDNGNRIQ